MNCVPAIVERLWVYPLPNPRIMQLYWNVANVTDISRDESEIVDHGCGCKKRVDDGSWPLSGPFSPEASCSEIDA